MNFYHFAHSPCEVGTIFTGLGTEHSDKWLLEGSVLKRLHDFKPPHLPAHHECVFMGKSLEEISLIIKPRKYILVLKPLDEVFAFDTSWAMSIIGQTQEDFDKRLSMYWTGKQEKEDFSAMEYLTRKVEVISCEINKNFDVNF